MHTKDFSIIITTFNDSENVESFVQSIANQTIRPSFLVVVDGGSHDNTLDVLKKATEAYGFCLISESGQRLNIAQGYNRAIKICKTEIFFIMGIGNTYPKNFIEKMFQEQKRTQTQIVYSPIQGNDKTAFAKVFNKAFVAYNPPMLGHDFGYASNRGVLISKSVFKNIGLFYDTFIYAGEDTEFFIRAKKLGIKSGYAKETYLTWDTPLNFHQYLKKCKVNALADIQCFPWSRLFANAISRLLFITCFLFFIIIGYWYFSLSLILLLLSIICMKTKSMNWAVLLLRLHFFFLPSYYYLLFINKFKKNMVVYNNPVPQL